MGDSIEQWRATIGQWSGGRPRKCVTSQHHIAKTSDQVGYKYIRFFGAAFATGHRLCGTEPKTTPFKICHTL